MTVPIGLDGLVPDDGEVNAEINRDRRHERYLLRSAAVAVLVIALAITVRVVWG
jgi:hypothetical protein